MFRIQQYKLESMQVIEWCWEPFRQGVGLLKGSRHLRSRRKLFPPDDLYRSPPKSKPTLADHSSPMGHGHYSLS
ncbi:uncharacterized protein UV8b_07840 [Ustilaginoidea virens]|uniref:Uncharacterized protein n=1 Tax=Ustilaginoidea virens TaxID=1159556 RepID=A0A8E5HXR7_USTVR|nr:uncharacterized protein UV8b_07840 [Ustilaginoidea virens]QUC23599.1 hypothetical protein UV8b_07840 [Ustilaginoidea virens]